MSGLCQTACLPRTVGGKQVLRGRRNQVREEQPVARESSNSGATGESRLGRLEC